MPLASLYINLAPRETSARIMSGRFETAALWVYREIQGEKPIGSLGTESPTIGEHASEHQPTSVAASSFAHRWH